MLVTPGLELQELRSMYMRLKTAKMPFPTMMVTYAFNLDDKSFAELDTQDCGGPTVDSLSNVGVSSGMTLGKFDLTLKLLHRLD